MQLNKLYQVTLGTGDVVKAGARQQGNRQMDRNTPMCILRNPHTMGTKRGEGHSGHIHADDSKDTRNQCGQMKSA